jgi:hypothetical protein
LPANSRPDLPQGFTREKWKSVHKRMVFVFKGKSRFTWHARGILTTCTLHQDVPNCAQ